MYDGFGNRLQQNVTKGTAPSTVQTVDAATNRLNGAGFGYDSNGNMTGWSTPSGSVTASYDVENRMTQIVTPSVTETYAYGPGNLRVKKYQGGAWTYTVYGQGGEVLGTYSVCTVSGAPFLCQAKLRVYFGGRLVLSGWSGVTADRLGSPQGVHGRVYPYGEVSGSVSVDQDETFTTYKRDVSTGLDYAQNRYYASAWGRFTTADPYRASGGPEDPGSWNRYAYVENDPVSFVDPSGLNAAMPSVNTPPMNVVDFWSPMDTVMGYYSADNWWDGGVGGGGVGGGGPKSFMPSETGGVPSGGGGSSTKKEETTPQPSKDCFTPNWLQQKVITVEQKVAQKIGFPFGFGAGVSAGSGFGKLIGFSGTASAQMFVTPSGNASLVYTYGGSGLTTPWLSAQTKGAGVTAGLQFSSMTSQDPADLGGPSVDASIGGGDGLGGGGDLSFSGVIQGTLTLGFGVGGFGGAGVLTKTTVIPACSNKP